METTNSLADSSECVQIDFAISPCFLMLRHHDYRWAGFASRARTILGQWQVSGGLVLVSFVALVRLRFICSHAELPTRHDRDCSRRRLLVEPAIRVSRVAT